jgi:hypothetical protein
MPGGRHGHKMRELQRRIDAVLEKERERRRPLEPPPPPISEEHAALRRRIAEAHRALLDPEDPQGPDLQKRIAENTELACDAALILSLMRKERALLAEHGVDHRPYETYDLS